MSHRTVIDVAGAGELYEAAWDPTGSPDAVERFLGQRWPEATAEGRRALLAELAARDLDLHLQAGKAVSADDYLRRYPDLRDDPGAVRRLRGLEAGRRGWAGPCPAAPPGYAILGELGKGGMGVVYKARQLGLDRLCALKMIRAGGGVGEEQLARFQTEAEAVARLQHPNIVQVYEVGEHDGLPFLALEFCPGGSLDRRLDGPPWGPRQAAQLVETLARAMHHAHQRGVLHRDLKPSNVLLAPVPVGQAACLSLAEPGQAGCLSYEPKVSDFGLAKKLGEGSDTVTGAVLGTPSYMAPEQAQGRGKELSPACDVYALGAILYELLTGRPPFKATTPLDTLRQVADDDPVAPCRLQGRTPRDLETVCLKCLHKAPAGRYDSAGALADDLARFLRGQPVHARPVGAVGRFGRWCRRKPAVAALLAAVVVAVAAGFSASVVLWRRAANNEAQALANLRQEEVARRQAEDHLKMICKILYTNGLVTETSPLQAPEAGPVLAQLLREAEACLTALVRTRGGDQELKVLLFDVLFRLANHHDKHGRGGESLACLEKAAALFEPEPPGQAPRRADYLHSGVMAHRFLGSAYRRRGRARLAGRHYASSLRLWQRLAQCPPDRALGEDQAARGGFDLAQELLTAGHSAEEILHRFEPLRDGPELLGGARQYDLFLEFLKVNTLSSRAGSSGPPAAVLPVARAVAGVLDRLDRSPFPRREDRLWVALCCTNLSWRVRKGGAVKEALRLGECGNRTLQGLARETPADPHLFVKLNESWEQIGKAHWELDQEDETLAALGHALEAQRRACALAPAVAEYRLELGRRYLRLGRKYCELSRLDEAEDCFRKRQALWPGDAARHAEAVGELRSWANKVGKAGTELSPEQRLERQRYLDLWARLRANRGRVSGKD